MCVAFLFVVSVACPLPHDSPLMPPFWGEVSEAQRGEEENRN